MNSFEKNKKTVDTLMQLDYDYIIEPYCDESLDFKGLKASYKNLPVSVYCLENESPLEDLIKAKEEYFYTVLKENKSIKLP